MIGGILLSAVLATADCRPETWFAADITEITDARGFVANFAGYLGKLLKSGVKIDGTLVYSWECGCQTWTWKMEEEFERTTWTINGPKAGSPYRDAGLLGPVTLLYSTQRESRRYGVSLPSQGNDGVY